MVGDYFRPQGHCLHLTSISAELLSLNFLQVTRKRHLPQGLWIPRFVHDCLVQVLIVCPVAMQNIKTSATNARLDVSLIISFI